MILSESYIYDNFVGSDLQNKKITLIFRVSFESRCRKTTLGSLPLIFYEQVNDSQSGTYVIDLMDHFIF